MDPQDRPYRITPNARPSATILSWDSSYSMVKHLKKPAITVSDFSSCFFSFTKSMRKKRLIYLELKMDVVSDANLLKLCGAILRGYNRIVG